MNPWPRQQPHLSHKAVSNIIETLNKIDHLYSETSLEEADKMIEYVRGPVERSYFIQKLSGQFVTNWFEFACNRGILSFDQIPKAIRYEDAEGKVSYGFKNWEGAFAILEAAKAIPQNHGVTDLLLSLVDDYISMVQQQKNDTNRNFTADYHICRVILLLPLNLIGSKYLNFVIDFGLARDPSTLSRELVGSFFNRALKGDHDLAMRLLDLFFTPVFGKRQYKVHAKIDDYTLENFTKSAPPKLYEQLGNGVMEWALYKLDKVSEEEPLPFTKFELPSLEPDTQNSSESDFNFSIVRLVTGLLSELPTEELGAKLKSLLTSKQRIMRRIAYYLIDRKYKNLSGLFWKQPNPLNEWEAKLEIFRLVKRNGAQFDSDQVKTVVQWINDLIVDQGEKESAIEYKQHKAYRQLEWYLALEPIHYKYPDLLIQPYNKLQEITKGQVPSHPGYDSYFTIRPGGDYSQNNRILNKPAIDVLNMLANQQKWEGYNVYGLQQDVRDYVVASYSEVAGHLNEFQAIPISFIYNFMDGFRSIAEKTGTLNIPQTFSFINSFIDQRQDLWDFSEEGREKSSSVGMIAWVFNTVVRNNEYLLNVNDVKLAIDTLIKMENNYSLEFTWLNNDPVTDIMNSTRGKIYEALMGCSIREVKIQAAQPFWDEKVQQLFTKRLTTHPGSTEFYWSLGFNIPQISYLNMNWLKNNKNVLMEYKDDRFDNPVFYGYLLFSTQLYTNLFEFFYATYFSQVTALIDNSVATRRLAEHIWVAFAIDLPGANQLIDRLIQSENEQQLGFLIDRIKIEDGITKDQKIRYVWDTILPIAEKSGSKSLRNKAFEMVYFAELLSDFINHDLDLFMRTVSLGRSDINSYRLLKIIEAKLKTKNYALSGQLLEILLNNVTSEAFFDEGKLIEIIEVLYQNQELKLADQIAIAAVERRNFRVVSVYNKYHKV
jgi:hypothetical protein